MLLLANVFWGLSFPLIKAIAFAHQQLLPASGSWLITTCTIAPRFILAAAILAVWQRGALLRLTRSEIRQGAGLALFASAGMLFQNDGLQFTSASTSAFLTQFYAIMIPVWVALRRAKSRLGIGTPRHHRAGALPCACKRAASGSAADLCRLPSPAKGAGNAATPH